MPCWGSSWRSSAPCKYRLPTAVLLQFWKLSRKRRFRLTDTQKYRHRLRLRAVDTVVETLVESGVKLRAMELARRAPREHELTPLQKYWVESKRFRHGIKPIHWVPKWTRVAHGRKWTPSAVHHAEPPKGK
ncbi:mitochondrial ribosomal protein L31-domain-containing protein [Fimicolochytrium jonesii]|uniref:mitochondrial ribosomal protein L31-domain-containing protein n=1 Tax=Fimicolochytrium jonesii TaxID=1396493 RepID=UPI0022FE390B|nr:mitochondrial ribosomal protein L31-domain-containing protein [Fimicolochytrium jonesii]KAI8825836.1 mitochondrial ribosomal protein L31-domain-containing protein [Fimicolochytrium jonesii]